MWFGLVWCGPRVMDQRPALGNVLEPSTISLRTVTSHQEQLFQRKIVKPIPFTLQHGTSHQQVLLQERASCTCMCTSLGTTTSPNTELMSIDFRLGRKHCNERQFSARKRSMCLHSALAQDVLAPVDP